MSPTTTNIVPATNIELHDHSVSNTPNSYNTITHTGILRSIFCQTEPQRIPGTTCPLAVSATASIRTQLATGPQNCVRYAYIRRTTPRSCYDEQRSARAKNRHKSPWFDCPTADRHKLQKKTIPAAATPSHNRRRTLVAPAVPIPYTKGCKHHARDRKRQRTAQHGTPYSWHT